LPNKAVLIIKSGEERFGYPLLKAYSQRLKVSVVLVLN